MIKNLLRYCAPPPTTLSIQVGQNQPHLPHLRRRDREVEITNYVWYPSPHRPWIRRGPWRVGHDGEGGEEGGDGAPHRPLCGDRDSGVRVSALCVL